MELESGEKDEVRLLVVLHGLDQVGDEALQRHGESLALPVA